MTKSPVTADSTLTRDLMNAARYYLRGRRGLLVLSAVAVGAGLAFSWNWLVATSIVPFLLTILPCLVMGGLGHCTSKLTGKSCSSGETTKHTLEPPAENMPPQLPTPSNPAALEFRPEADQNILLAVEDVAVENPAVDKGNN